MILLLFGLTNLWKWLVITASILLWVFSLRASGVGSWPPVSIEHRRPSPARGSEWEYPTAYSPASTINLPSRGVRLLFIVAASPYRPGQAPDAYRYLQKACQLCVPAAAMASTPSVVNTSQELIGIRRLLAA